MIVFISPDRTRSSVIRNMLLSEDIFAFSNSFPSTNSFNGVEAFIKNLRIIPEIVIVDATESMDFGEEACLHITNIYPNVKCIALLSKTSASTSRFKYLKNSHYEIDTFPSSDLAVALRALLTRLGYSIKRHFAELDLGDDNKSASLLSYPLHLTHSEYRILLFLCNHTERIFSAEDILAFCFAESYRMKLTNVRSHISSINKKAKALSGRKLILCTRKTGYQLNHYM